MLISDLFEETFFAVFANKARSGLTILGIVIGIGSVIAMISIGQGTQVSIEERIQSIGSNLLMVYPGAQFSSGGHVSTGRGSAQNLTQKDADAIKEEVAFIKAVAPEKKIIQTPWPRLTHEEAMKKYNTDKPDLRKNKDDPNELAF